MGCIIRGGGKRRKEGSATLVLLAEAFHDGGQAMLRHAGTQRMRAAQSRRVGRVAVCSPMHCMHLVVMVSGSRRAGGGREGAGCAPACLQQQQQRTPTDEALSCGEEGTKIASFVHVLGSPGRFVGDAGQAPAGLPVHQAIFHVSRRIRQSSSSSRPSLSSASTSSGVLGARCLAQDSNQFHARVC